MALAGCTHEVSQSRALSGASLTLENGSKRCTCCYCRFNALRRWMVRVSINNPSPRHTSSKRCCRERQRKNWNWSKKSNKKNWYDYSSTENKPQNRVLIKLLLRKNVRLKSFFSYSWEKGKTSETYLIFIENFLWDKNLPDFAWKV